MLKSLPKITLLGDACCGCGACAARCPKSCIGMITDGCGFPTPMVNLDVCIGCGGCDSVCPAMGERPKDGAQSVLWAKSRDRGERLASSSGGVFGLLALDVLADGGVVCGALGMRAADMCGTCSLKTGQISIPSCVPSMCRARSAARPTRACGRLCAVAGECSSPAPRAKLRA